MANLQRILKRQPGVEEAEIEAVRSRVLVRLAAMSRGGAESPEDAPAPEPPLVDGSEEPIATVIPPPTDAARFDPSAVPVVPDAPSPTVTISPLLDDTEESGAAVAPPTSGRAPAETDAPAPRLVSFARPANVAHSMKAPEDDGWDEDRSTAPAVARAAVATDAPVIRVRPPARPLAATRKARPAVTEAIPDPPAIEAVPPAETSAAEESTVIEADPPAEALTVLEATVIEAGPPAQAVLFAIDEDTILTVEAVGPAVIEADPPSEPSGPAVAERPSVQAQSEVAPRPGPRRPARSSRATAAGPARSTGDRGTTPPSPTRPGPTDATAYCPYCATVLEPPPDTTRRCSRCHQRIVVRRLETRMVYLAEAAVPVFEAERRRAANAERWGRERDRWLDLAREAGASADRVTHSAKEPPSEAGVVASRALYMSTVDRSFRVARSDRRWEEAASSRYEQALALYRIAGSPATPSDAVVKLHREGLAAALHGIGEVAKDAELRGAPCCEACGTDQGRIVRIVDELRAPSLPHKGCPRGLCRCRWLITARDQAFLSEFLRRQARANRRLSALPPED